MAMLEDIHSLKEHVTFPWCLLGALPFQTLQMSTPILAKAGKFSS